jgi:hypothetical protein
MEYVSEAEESGDLEGGEARKRPLVYLLSYYHINT